MRLFTYFRSSAAYRVRIGLELKGLVAEQVAVDLRTGAQRDAAFMARNPQGLVPVLLDGNVALTQSLAILEYLDETHPRPPLLPRAAAARARVRQIAHLIACDLHPLNNLRVLQYLRDELMLTESAREHWMDHWMAAGLGAVEALLEGDPATGRFCHGNDPTLADLCVVPQLYNARRFACDLSPYPTLLRIDSECRKHPAFERAAPEQQPDAS